MKKLIFFTTMLAILLAACSPRTADETGTHDVAAIKLQLISYNQDYELFAEADPFVVDQPSSILAHFTYLDDFSPLESGSITVSLVIGSNGIRQTIDAPIRDGIYSFRLTPVAAGIGKIIFDIKNTGGESQVIVDTIVVYSDSYDAIHEAEEQQISDPNGIVFTKEQSWKVDFSTIEVAKESFGQVIKTSALIQPTQYDKVSVAARTSGIVIASGDNIYEGTAVTAGKELFIISGAGMAGDNTHVRFVEAKNNYEESLAHYERKKSLAEDKIVSESELLEAKNDYEIAKVIYESLKDNFTMGEQIVKSPIDGFVNHLYVIDGEYVESGQPLIDIAQNKKLVLMADVQQKYAGILQHIVDANIRCIQNRKTYTLEDLNGRLSSYGRSVNHDNYLIPVRFEIDNTEGFVPGSFVELYIITLSDQAVITVPNGALLEEQGKYFVLVQLTPELFSKREVKLGVTDGLRTEVVSGIKEQDRVVSRGAILIKLSQASGALDPHAGHVH